jgi:DNA-binding response OmpR family regulator
MIRVMIVDDDKNFVDTFYDDLKEKLGECEIFVAYSFKEALDILTNHSNLCDVIICDVAVGDMSGIDFLKLIKASEKLKNINVIMISAKYVEPMDRIEALKNGAVAYFVKPFDIEKIANEIKYYARKK